MEIKIAFATIIGLIMMITVIIAVIVMMAGLTQFSVSECVPAEYTALQSYNGLNCGLNSNNQQVKCDVKGGPHLTYDDCMDSTKNLCCPTQTKQNIKLINGKCCNITRL